VLFESQKSMRLEDQVYRALVTTSVSENAALGEVVIAMHGGQSVSGVPLGWADTQRWPRYEFESVGTRRCLDRLVTEFADYQLVHIDPRTEQIVGCGMSIPFHWDGAESGFPTGWDDVLQLGLSQREAGVAPNQMSALTITILPAHQGSGLARSALQAFINIARKMKFQNVFAPVRPVLKMKYPLAKIEDYVTWSNRKGQIFDPWLRLHHQFGGKYLGLAKDSVTVIATVSDWEDWTGMQFPQSDDYVVPGALVPVSVDLERDRVIYRQPNVWMAHVVAHDRGSVGSDAFPATTQSRRR
jgi:hypothetical protein